MIPGSFGFSETFFRIAILRMLNLREVDSNELEQIAEATYFTFICVLNCSRPEGEN